LAQAVVSLPDVHDSLAAEGNGLRLAFSLVQACVGHPGHLAVLGDNLPLLKSAAVTGKLRSDPTLAIVDAPLTHAARQRWTCRWTAVRRLFNCLADKLATRGTLSAVESRANGRHTPHVWLWTDPAVFDVSTMQPQLPWVPMDTTRSAEPLYIMN